MKHFLHSRIYMWCLEGCRVWTSISKFLFSHHVPIYLYHFVIPRLCVSSLQLLSEKPLYLFQVFLLFIKRCVTIMWMVVSWSKGYESCLACRSWTGSVICSIWNGTQLAGWGISLCWPMQLSQQNSLGKSNYTSERFLFLMFILSAEVPLKSFCQ